MQLLPPPKVRRPFADNGAAERAKEALYDLEWCFEQGDYRCVHMVVRNILDAVHELVEVSEFLAEENKAMHVECTSLRNAAIYAILDLQNRCYLKSEKLRTVFEGQNKSKRKKAKQRKADEKMQQEKVQQEQAPQ